jgi:glyoxylase-like metal-dependent hydrolase (beta-lactamase superfamily II)
VFFTHLHPDHVGWNLTQGSSGVVATFPRAKYVAHQADWDTFRKPEVQEAFPAPFWNETLGPLEALGVVKRLSGEHALTREVTAIPTPGHTPGSMSLVVVSGGQRALILGDVFHSPAQVTETEWVFSFDMDPDLAIETRRRMIDRAEAENAVVGVCHHTGFGRIVRFQGRRYWQGL